MTPGNSFKARMARIGLSGATLAELASIPKSRVYPTEVSAWLANRGLPKGKRRLTGTLFKIERLVKESTVRPDLSDAANIRAAIERQETSRNLSEACPR